MEEKREFAEGEGYVPHPPFVEKKEWCFWLGVITFLVGFHLLLKTHILYFQALHAIGMPPFPMDMESFKFIMDMLNLGTGGMMDRLNIGGLVLLAWSGLFFLAHKLSNESKKKEYEKRIAQQTNRALYEEQVRKQKESLSDKARENAKRESMENADEE